MATKLVSSHIPAALADRIEAAAARMQRPREWVVPQALADWADLEEHRHELTLDGLADVDEGRVIEHERVLAWARSLGSDQPVVAPSA